jgi:glycosyltransferase involved in cell wall biosynthesis
MPSVSMSIITPVWNGRVGIERALRSVHDVPVAGVEHLVLDAGSTDGTREWLERYAAERTALRLFFEKDRGQSDAMNRGISEARGRIVGFLNADDFYEPGAIAEALRTFETLPEPSLLVGGCHVRDATGRVVAVNRPRRLRREDLLWGGWLCPHPYNPTGYFYHRSLHACVGTYDENDHYTMDLDFLLRAVLLAQVVPSDAVFGNYTWAPGTKSWEDRARGTAFARKEAVFRRYETPLGPTARILRRWARWATDTGLPAWNAARARREKPRRFSTWPRPEKAR